MPSDESDSPSPSEETDDSALSAYPSGETSRLAQDGAEGAICPRCGSWQVVAGHLLDGLGQSVRFALMYRQRAPGVSANDAPPVIALYCNECGEVTFTLG